MKQKLIDSLNFRMATELSLQNPVKFLKQLRDSKKMPIDEMVDIAVGVIYLYTRTKGSHKKPAYMSEVICAIGHTIRNKTKQVRNSALASKAGAFILYSFQDCGIIEVILGKGQTGHGAYIVSLINDDMISELFHKIPPNVTEKLPSITPFKLWDSAYHNTGITLVKTGNKDVLALLKPEDFPIVFEVVNRKMQIGWNINKEIHELSLWALRNKTNAFSDIWEQHNPEARTTKLREARTIAEIAKRFLNTTFYH